jgi:hypothetical protein
VITRGTRVVGGGHLQLTLASAGSETSAPRLDAIAFGMAKSDPGVGAAIHAIGVLEIDSYRGSRRTRLRVKHLFRAAS